MIALEVAGQVCAALFWGALVLSTVIHLRWGRHVATGSSAYALKCPARTESPLSERGMSTVASPPMGGGRPLRGRHG